MNFEIFWAPAALHAFYRLPMHSAALVDRAVIRFADSGEGQLDWDPPYHLLRAGFYDLVLVMNRANSSVTVLRIYRAR